MKITNKLQLLFLLPTLFLQILSDQYSEELENLMKNNPIYVPTNEESATALSAEVKDPADKCLVQSTQQYLRCLECVVGYGPFPQADGSYKCIPCLKGKIENCEKCQWLYTPDKKSTTYHCMNCTKGFYPMGSTDIEAPDHYGDTCVKCPTNCVDCMTLKFCTLCPFDREVYLPPNYYVFEPVRYCRYYFKYKMMYLGIYVYVTLIGFFILKKIFCGFTNTISKKFIGAKQRSAPNLGKLMKAKKVKEGKGSKKYQQYTPRMSKMDDVSWNSSQVTYRNHLSVAEKENSLMM